MTDTYEGWSNRETWAANLWLSNDEGLYRQVSEMAARALDEATDDGDPGIPHRARYALGEELRVMFEEWEADVVDGTATEELRRMILDIGSLYRVDWHEVAEGWIDAAISEQES